MATGRPPAAVAEPPWAGLVEGAGGREQAVRPAGVWRRAFALLADALVWLLLFLAGGVLTGALARWDLVSRAFGLTYALVVPAAYIVLMHGTSGQTLGKMLAGVRVVGASGDPLGYPRALGRFLVWVLLALPLLLPLLLGFVMAATRNDRRALHDLIADTRVVRVR